MKKHNRKGLQHAYRAGARYYLNRLAEQLREARLGLRLRKVDHDRALHALVFHRNRQGHIVESAATNARRLTKMVQRLQRTAHG